MEYIADLHIHSPYSRATSKESTLAGLYGWAKLKGINVVASGDFTHPAWLAQLKELLEPAEPGFFRLKNEVLLPSPFPEVPLSKNPLRFLLSAEICCIYNRHDKVRKVHNLLYLPDFASADRINARLSALGNIVSDGRPILGLDSRNLLEILLETAPDGYLVPAHIWTPWFSLFGSRSGFDSVEECFGDLSAHVFALETGLSSDPAMNRLISGLDSYALLSNSDCHSPSKLGREANLFATGFDFFSLREAIRVNSKESFRGTVEFFPEEGKYHFDGHVDCNICLEPAASRELGNICPVCKKRLTIGVQHRVMDLADRNEPLFSDDSPQVFSLIPLVEILGELVGAGSSSKTVLKAYAKALSIFGSEFELLLNTSLKDIEHQSPLLAEAVRRVREGNVIRQPGYDGRFGAIRAFTPGEISREGKAKSIFTG